VGCTQSTKNCSLEINKGLWATRQFSTAKKLYKDSCAFITKTGRCPQEIDIRCGDQRLDDISSALHINAWAQEAEIRMVTNITMPRGQLLLLEERTFSEAMRKLQLHPLLACIACINEHQI